MSILNKYNSTSDKFNFSTEGLEFTTSHELISSYTIDAIYNVYMMFINEKSEFGSQPVLCTEKFLYSAPHHMIDTIRDMLLDDEVIDACNNGTLAFTLREYVSTKTTDKCYSIKWCITEPKPYSATPALTPNDEAFSE